MLFTEDMIDNMMTCHSNPDRVPIYQNIKAAAKAFVRVVVGGHHRTRRTVLKMKVLVTVLLLATMGFAESDTTLFPGTENPISESGKWTNGKTTGLDWTNVITTPGKAMGTETAIPDYSDSTATLQYRSWADDQRAYGTVFIGGGSISSCGQEIELRLRTTITPHSITGYEVSFSSAFGSLIIVRWDGPLGAGHFDVLNMNAGVVVHNGDVIKATIVGNVITAYINGVQKLQATDSKFATGSPGVGFNYTPNPGCTGAARAKYGLSSFTAEEEESASQPQPAPTPPSGLTAIVH
jgi:hypothetical protein